MSYRSEIVLTRDGKVERYGLRCEDASLITELVVSGLYRLKESLQGATLIKFTIEPESIAAEVPQGEPE